MTPAPQRPPGSGASTPKLIWICSLGTIFEWYDFFLYGAVANVLSRQFFPAANPVASFLLVLATFGAGFAVRPIGAFVFGSLGDRIGRKYTFVTTMALMGASTAAIGVLPTHDTAGVWASVLLVICRILQGLALGGEYGGAAIYVAEHAPQGRRGLHTSWIQLSAAVGFLLALAVTMAVSRGLGSEAWSAWSWRLPFLLSVIMLAISLYWRLSLQESPVFQALREGRQVSQTPIRDSLSAPANRRMILVALFGVTAGQTVIWFTAQFSTLYALEQQGGLDIGTATGLMAIATMIAAPSFVLGGWLSDRFGRRAVLMSAYVLALVLLVPVFANLQRIANPARAHAASVAPVVVKARSCDLDVFPTTRANDCSHAVSFLRSRGIDYRIEESPSWRVELWVGGVLVPSLDDTQLEAALRAPGYLESAALTWQRRVLLVALAAALITVAGLAYGPTAATLVELFPARVRYTSMSIPYHIGAGYFGGFQPFVSQYLAARTGSFQLGLVYPLGVLVVALVVCVFLLPETRHRDIGA